MLSRERVSTPVVVPGTPPPPTAGSVAVTGGAQPVRIGRRKWRPGLLLGGTALVVGSMLAGLMLFSSGRTTSPVLVAAHDLVPGESLTNDDFLLRDVALDGTFEAVTAAEQRAIFSDGVERTVQVFVPEGSIVTERHFVARSEAVPEGKTVVGMKLKAGDYPAGIAIGDKVALFGTGDQATASAADLGIGEVRYALVDDRTGDLVADVLIDEGVRLKVIQAQSVDRLILGLVRNG